MGGTFDPPHFGHLMIAESMREELHLDAVWFMPNGKGIYKEASCMTTPQERLEMVRLAVQGNAAFSVEDIEVRRGGITYTYQTMEELNRRESETEFTFLMGADSLDYMERWKYPERIFACCKIAAVLRSGISLSRMQAKKRELETVYGAEIILTEAPQISVSSTQLRQRIVEGKSIRYLVPDAVEEYIYAHGLYRRERGTYAKYDRN